MINPFNTFTYQKVDIFKVLSFLPNIPTLTFYKRRELRFLGHLLGVRYFMEII